MELLYPLLYCGYCIQVSNLQFKAWCQVNRHASHPQDVWLCLIVVRTSIIYPFCLFQNSLAVSVEHKSLIRQLNDFIFFNTTLKLQVQYCSIFFSPLAYFYVPLFNFHQNLSSHEFFSRQINIPIFSFCKKGMEVNDTELCHKIGNCGIFQ